MNCSPVMSSHHVAEDAEGRVVIVGEEDARCDDGEHHRCQHENEEVLAKRKLLGEEHGQQKADDHLRRDREDHEHRRIDQRVPVRFGGQIVGQHLDVVVEPDEADRLLVGLVGEEGKTQRPEQREDVHDEEHGNGRRHQKATIVAAAIGVDHEGGSNERHHGANDPEGRRRRKQDGRQNRDDQAHDDGKLPIVWRDAEERRWLRSCCERIHVVRNIRSR